MRSSLFIAPILTPLFALSFGTAQVAHVAYAAEMSLTAQRLQTLGIATQAVSSAGKAQVASLAAKVTVPNGQLRVVAAPVAGMVSRLLVNPGTQVKAGQVVAELASPEALALQRDALQANSQAQLAQQSLRRDEQLFAEGLIAEARVQASRANAAQAGALASERRQSLQLAGASSGNIGGALRLTAPMAGVIVEQGVQVGQRVEAATLLYRLAQTDPLWLEMQAPQALASRLKVGMMVRVKESDSRQDKAVLGKIFSIGAALDAASQTVPIWAEVRGSNSNLRPGQVLEVGLEQAENALNSGNANNPSRQTLPSSALVRHEGQVLIFLAENDNKHAGQTRFVPQAVELLSQSGEQAVIKALPAAALANRRVVVQGASSLKAILSGIGQDGVAQ